MTSKPVVLVVDDETFTQKVFSDALESAGFAVTIAPDGATAIRAVTAAPPDLVLLDLVMPGMDGFRTCRELRKIPSAKFLPILVVTGRGDTESIHGAFEAGASDFVSKPIHPDLLVYRVRYMLRANRTIQELAESEARLRTVKEAIDALPIGFTITDAHGRITYSNPAEAEMHGYAQQDLVNLDARTLAPTRLWKVAPPQEVQNIGVWKRESVNVRKDGEEFPVSLCSLAVKDADGTFLGVVTSCEDITSRKKTEEKIQHLAFHDMLTGLPNRSMFLESLNHALALARREERRVALLFLDLDNFKDINDTRGHDFGDLLLREVAARLAGVVRGSDMLARLGGDELVVILPAVEDQESIAAAAQRLLNVFKRPFEVRGEATYASASMGIAVFPDDGSDCDSLYRSADMAMYEAKKDPLTKFRFFNKEMNEKIARRVTLINRMREGVEKNGIYLLYQPQINLLNGMISGVESLIRWHDEELGQLDPEEFLPLAEKTGEICRMGEWVLRTACTQAAGWNATGRTLKLAVNISAQQLKQRSFVGNVRKIIRETGLPAHQLELEITESVIMEQDGSVLESLKSLKAMGISLAIDDFGTGYSSLSYLKNFPIDRIKIDRSFIKGVHTDANNAAIVDAILLMARKLNVSVVAEGVEDEDQLAFLSSRNCHEIQGFLFSTPLTPAEIVAAVGPLPIPGFDRIQIKSPAQIM